MKKRNRIYPALIVIMTFILLVPSCTKKKISYGPAETPTAEEQARQKAEEEARQRELERQKAIKEETLKEESLEKEDVTAKIGKELKLTDQAVFENEDIFYEFDSIRLSPEAQDILRKKGRWLQENPAITVTIEGHCDSRGTNEYNLALGDRRAHSAKIFLVELGIDESRLQTISYGEERPVDPGEDEKAWAKNRRAHFLINQ